MASGPLLQSAPVALPRPYLLFLGDVTHPAYAKTGFGLRDWAGEHCLGEFSCEGATVTLGLPRLTPAEARARGARSLIIGVANSGGFIPPSWRGALLEALAAGLDIVSGMHVRLGSFPELADAAARLGRQLIDVRTPPRGIPVATGRKRTGKRLLTVGTDCAVGKKYTALALHRAFTQRGVDATFRATGQTGILIAGGGMPMDAVISDFAAGAAEILSPDAADDHWDVIEGQGSILHPAFAGVSLALLHGSQPDVLVVCHAHDREEAVGTPGYRVPAIEDVMDLSLRLGARVNPAIRCAGVSLNTGGLEEDAARTLLEETGRRLGLPVADPVRGGAPFERLVDACLG
jgi:uncharacterized NAD-dependent epimerase/dehydratase family protein